MWDGSVRVDWDEGRKSGVITIQQPDSCASRFPSASVTAHAVGLTRYYPSFSVISFSS
jgi:hypothetical protein